MFFRLQPYNPTTHPVIFLLIRRLSVVTFVFKPNEASYNHLQQKQGYNK